MKIKALLYSTKANPTLYNVLGKFITTKYMGKDFMQDGVTHPELNGKIAAECDFEVEEIFQEFENETDRTGLFWYRTNNLIEKELLERSGLTITELNEYLEPLEQKYVYGKGWQIKPNGYAIHIKNLHIFDKPKELNEYMSGKFEEGDYRDLYELEKAPQNMQYVSTWYSDEISMWGDTYILISIKPEWLCKILNGEKTIEVRKKVLKEMITND